MKGQPQEPPTAAPKARARRRRAAPGLIVGIGASAGGLKALQTFFTALSTAVDMTFVIILHLAPEWESLIAELLQPHTAMKVMQVAKKVTMKPNHIYVIAPGQQLTVRAGQLLMAPFAEPRGQWTPIDIFFRSLAAHQGDAVAMILSGSGTDGALGLKAIKEQGGLIMVQDPQEAEYDSMPRSALATGLVDIVLPLAGLAQELLTYQQSKRTIQLPTEPSDLPAEARDAVQQILTLLQVRTGHDFSQYKRSTVLRRLGRRMQLTRSATLARYINLLDQQPDEVELLFHDFLIGVTSFFRDREPFQALTEQVMPHLFAGKQSGETVRVWVVGCATGEEAYSLAMLLLEQAARLDQAPDLQVFATDLDEAALQIARQGVYSAAIATAMPEERLTRFFSQEDGHYRVKTEMREHMLFAVHNLLKDPPFANLDLISCRNLLIYLQRELQERVFEIFHYALRPQGYLFLGTAESAESAAELFTAVDKKQRIYQSQLRTDAHPRWPLLPLPSTILARSAQDNVPAAPVQRTREELQRQLLEAYAPPSLLVDEHSTVLNMSENAGRYLLHPSGAITSEVTRLIRPELQFELRSALYQAFEHGQPTLTPPIAVQFNGTPHLVVLSVQPRRQAEDQRLALVMFLEDAGRAPDSPTYSVKTRDRDQRMQRLEAELQHTLARLQTRQEEHEAAEEELKASNEELQSINEEFKSTLEELETSKEELQSINEELQTVNQELKSKVEEVGQVNSDLQNLLAATDIATLFLDRTLAIKPYTPQMIELFNLKPSDHGRPIGDFKPKMAYTTLEVDAQRTFQDLMPIEREAQGENGRWYLVRFRPYRTVYDRIEGVVITFVDVSAHKQMEEQTRAAHAALQVEMAERARAEQARQQVLGQLVSAQEEERRRIAHELHDSLGQYLSALHLGLQSVQTQDGCPAPVLEGLQQLRALALRIDEEVDRLSFELRPPALDDLGLADALRAHVEQWSAASGIAVDLHSTGMERTRLPPVVETTVYRIVQEALTNVRKHASATHVSLILEQRRGEVVAIIEDDGRGFDYEAVLRTTRRLGLKGSAERAALAGGRLDIESAPGAGTTVYVHIPLLSEPSDGG